MKAIARINDFSWNTSIWYDKKEEAHLLPIKQEVRKINLLKQSDLVDVVIYV